MSDIQRLHPGPRISQAAIHNGTVYLAGQIASDSPDADIAGQTREVLGKVERLLTEAGSDKSRILHCMIYLRDMADIAAMNAVWLEWIPADARPPRAAVQAPLADPR